MCATDDLPLTGVAPVWLRTSVDAALEHLGAGAPVVLHVPEGTHGEAFLVAAARALTPEVVTTMLLEARGVPWLALDDERCLALGLTALATEPVAHVPAFTATIEARDGVTTGVSAADRARTMRLAADPATEAGEIVKPGHVFPIQVHSDGIMGRLGAAEAAAELAALAGLPGGAALCPLLGPEGEPAGAAEAEALATRLELELVTALDVMDRRLRGERLIERLAEEPLQCAGQRLTAVTYRDAISGGRHVAVRCGEVAGPGPVAVRVCEQRLAADVFADERPPHGMLAELANEAPAVLLYLAPTALAAGAHGGTPLATLQRVHVTTRILRDLGVAALRPGAPARLNLVTEP